jgi:putative addiction module CopG family antidote
MPIDVSPGTEAVIQQEVQRGPYRSASEFVEQAVAMLHEHEEWFSANRAEIAKKIEQGYASAQRGDLIDEQQLRERMAVRKQEWLAQSGREIRSDLVE